MPDSRSLYGIACQSAFLFPSVPRSRSKPKIRFLRAPRGFFQALRRKEKIPGRRVPLCHKSLPDGADYVRYFDIGEFWISRDGRKVLARALKSEKSETFLMHLYSHACSFALIKLKEEPLHATVVEKNGKAAALLGDPGDGKSTLAFFLIQKGFNLITDDLLRLSEKAGKVWAHPGMMRIKLFPKTAKALDAKAKPSAMNPETRKSIYTLEKSRAVINPAVLERIYLLPSQRHKSWLQKVHFRQVKGRSALVEIMNATYNQIAHPSARPKQMLNFADGLSRKVTMRALNYPRGLRHLMEIKQLIERDLEV